MNIINMRSCLLTLSFVFMFNGCGAGNDTIEKSSNVYILGVNVKSIKFSENNGIVTIKWDSVPDASYYSIERAISIYGPWIRLNSQITEPEYTDTGTGGEKYFYAIKAHTDISSSKYKAVASYTFTAKNLNETENVSSGLVDNDAVGTSNTSVSSNNDKIEEEETIITDTDETIKSIFHNGVEYNTVTSPYTGRIWLDRNLGAREACAAFNDENCYGDYYQWGRDTDGHEKSSSETIGILANKVTPVGHHKFIVQTDVSNNWDWVEYSIDGQGSKRKANWSKTDGSRVCPIGFRVPTIYELSDETINLMGTDKINNSIDAFNNFLKLPSAGYRQYVDGSLGALGGTVFLWSTTVQSSTSYAILIHDFSQVAVDAFRTDGYPIRCIQENNTSSIFLLPDENTNMVDSATLVNDINTITFRGVTTVDNRYTYTLSRGDTNNIGYLFIYDIGYLKDNELPVKQIKITNFSGQHILAYGDYLYVTGSELRIFDISDRLNPNLVNTLNYESTWNEPTIEEGKLLLPPSLGKTESYLLDLSTPNKPSLLSTLDNTPFSVFANSFIYSVNQNGNVVKYQLIDNNILSQISISDNTISEIPYYIYYDNAKLVVFCEDFYNGSKVYIYDTENNLKLLKTLDVTSVRSSGCKSNICISGNQIFDLNNFNQGVTELNIDNVGTGDGFPFQINFTNDYTIRSGDYNLKVDKLND